jgi:hypothetical protein
MNTLTSLAFASLCLLPAPEGRLPQDPKPPAAFDLTPGKVDPALLKKLAWLSGTWVFESGGKVTEEHWRPLQGTTILGSSHTYDAEKTHFFEHLRITAMRGTIAYLAMPGGKPPTMFLLSKLDDSCMEFENEKHDHPQRIRYERTKDGITATISQLDGSRAQSFAFRSKP